MANLHVDFTGDCTGLQNASDGANRAIDAVAGRNASVGITLVGSDSAVNGLRSVGAAREAAGGTVMVGVDTRQVESGRDSLRGLGSDARQAGRDFDAVGGSRSIGIRDDGSLTRMGRDVSALSGGLRTLGGDGASALGDLQAQTSAVGRSTGAMSSSFEMSDRALQSMNTTAEGSTATIGNLSEAHAELATNTAASAEGTSRVERSLGSTQTMTRALTADVEDLNSAMSGGGASALFGSGGGASGGGGGSMGGGAQSLFRGTPRGVPSTQGAGGGPPPPTYSGGGGGGGGGGGYGRGDNERPGRLMREGGMSGGGPAMMLGMIGLAEVAGAAAIGLMAVNAVTAAVPGLALAAGRAQREMGQGIREGADGALSAGIPAYRELGTALHGLGEEVGHVGAANISQIVGAEAKLAESATTTLRSLEPAIAPAIAGMTSLGEAVLTGLASPAVTQSIAAFGNQLATPQMTEGLSNIVTAIATVAPYVGQGFAGAFADIGGQGQGASNVGTGWKTQPVGETVAENSGGFFSYDQNTDMGYAAPAPLPGGGAGVGWNQDTTTGRWMTALGATAHTAGLAAVDTLNTSALTGEAAPELHAAGDDFSARWGAALSGQAPAGAVTPSQGGPASPSQLAAAQSQAPFGWVIGQDGTYQPATAPPPQPTPSRDVPASSPGATGGFGSGAPTPATAQALQQLNSVLPQTTQQTQTATNSIQQLGNQTPNSLAQIAQIAPAIDNSLAQAGSQIQSGSQDLGAAIPKSMGDGIAGNQAAACAAAQKLGDGTANCGKASVLAASPSKTFMELGGWISEGLAIGITDGAPAAVGAVQSAMSQVVAAGQTGIQASSPSKTFQAVGQQAMANVGAGAATNAQGPNGPQAPSGRTEAQQRQDTLRAQTGATMPQQRMADVQKENEQASQNEANQNSPAAKARKAYEDSLKGRGFTDSTNEDVMKRYDKRAERAADQQKERDQNAKTALEALGIKGLKSPDENDPDSLKSPHNQIADSRRDARTKLQQDTMKAALDGIDRGDLAKKAENDGQKTADGLRDGIKKGSEGPAKAAGDMANDVNEETKKKHGVNSPSTVFHDIGGELMAGLSNGITAGGGGVSRSVGDTMSGAFGSGVTAASNGVLGIASNSGLAVGYQWARSVATGADTVLKSADFKSISIPQIGSQLAKTALGDLGLLGPAGSGGSIPLNSAITMSGGTPATPAPIQLTINLDGKPFREMTVEQVNEAIGQLADLIPQQAG